MKILLEDSVGPDLDVLGSQAMLNFIGSIAFEKY
jgi:hypothetical protein